MFERKTVTVMGGDMRQVALAERFAADGFEMKAYGIPHDLFSDKICVVQDVESAIEHAHVVILPLPASTDGQRVNFPLLTDVKAPKLTDLFDKLPQNTLLFGGKISPAIKALAEEKGVRLIDYFDIEELQQKNALPTAEGAMLILMREIPRTVASLPVAVTGYGRVAKALVKLLLSMGACVTVVARKQADVSAAEAMGCRGILLDGKKEGMLALSNGFAAIFNTVPAWIFDNKVLESMSKETLLIDLSSAPGGVDANAATKYGVRVIWALSLPGKYAPVTAGEIIAETVLDVMRREDIV